MNGYAKDMWLIKSLPKRLPESVAVAWRQFMSTSPNSDYESQRDDA